jgi:transmembrane sensor
MLAAIGALTAAYWWESRSETFFQTAIGESASVSLPDGSSLELNSNSLASVDFEPQRRIIHLQRGEAFFKVAHDTRRPFWVVAGHSWVRAVGTAFNVYLRPTDVEVTVSEGTVKVASHEREREIPSDEALAATPVSILNAGDQADLGKQMATIRGLPPADLRRSMAWRVGTLYFENRPLSEVVEEMSRYTPLRLEIEDPTLRELPIGATFHANPEGAEALLRMLQDGLGLQVRREGKQRALIARRPDQQ